MYLSAATLISPSTLVLLVVNTFRLSSFLIRLKYCCVSLSEASTFTLLINSNIFLLTIIEVTSSCPSNLSNACAKNGLETNTNTNVSSIFLLQLKLLLFLSLLIVAFIFFIFFFKLFFVFCCLFEGIKNHFLSVFGSR